MFILLLNFLRVLTDEVDLVWGTRKKRRTLNILISAPGAADGTDLVISMSFH